MSLITVEKKAWFQPAAGPLAVSRSHDLSRYAAPRGFARRRDPPKKPRH